MKGEGVMKNIIIAINPSKDNEGKILTLVYSKINKVFTEASIDVLNSYEISDIQFTKEYDLLIVLGGDGTLLGIARDISQKYNIPIMGINIGNLGFLSSIELQDIDKALEEIKNKKFYIEKRLMLECITEDKELRVENTALNDVVIARGTLSRVAKFMVYVDGKLYYTFKADGVIISTPTGSTAYSFSAGGPFIYPDVEVINIIPICPHSKGVQSMILKSSSMIEVIAENYNGEIYLTFDGQKSTQIKDKTLIKIRKAKSYAKILQLNNYDYFNVLRKKVLNYSEE